MATPIANPVIVLSLDNKPFSASLNAAVGMASSYGTKIGLALAGSIANSAKGIGKAVSGAVGGIGGVVGSAVKGASAGTNGIGGALLAPMKMMAMLNQVMGFANKAIQIFGAPIRSAMAGEARQAQFTGTGSIDIATSDTWTGVLGRFQNTVEDVFQQIADSLDKVFDIKGWMEYARGAIAGVGALFSSWANMAGGIKPAELKDAFKMGALALINAWEAVGKIVVQIANVFIGILNALDAKAKILGAQNVIARGLAAGGEFLGILPAGVGNFLAQDQARQEQARRNAQIQLLNPAIIPGMANAARNIIQNGNAAADAERRALEWRDKIGGNLAVNVQSRIAPLLAAGTSALEEALVKARVQTEGGTLQQRIEAAMLEQIEIEKGQVNVLNAIKAVIQNKPGLVLMGG